KNRAFRLLEVSLTEQDSVRFSSLVLLSPLPSLSCPNHKIKNLHLSAPYQGGTAIAGGFIRCTITEKWYNENPYKR
ncbi:MAG: hypothetical protein RIE73_15610, partial [Coleofasciculus sp. C1-SOL-03]|uniref:hypothetical protein n=1 Tax=Coleofasciculus sp. C1-SOL-03 TaxID=3069522 RepID=UPI0032FF1C98